MAEWLIVILALSVLGAVWAYWRARKLHTRIERQFPGTTAIMTHHKKPARH